MGIPPQNSRILVLSLRVSPESLSLSLERSGFNTLGSEKKVRTSEFFKFFIPEVYCLKGLLFIDLGYGKPNTN
jgi:hypothetical protein